MTAQQNGYGLEVQYDHFEEKALEGPIHFIALCYDAICYDVDLYDCVDLLVSIGEEFYRISTKQIDQDDADFVFHLCYEFDPEEFPRRILTTNEEPLRFIRREPEDDALPVLRFHLGERPILLTADIGEIMIGFSGEDVDGNQVIFDHEALLNDDLNNA